ncbi:MAG: bifunctional ornithine acetyltransferase/N-acetylglutamate synthase, partial [Spirochaetia bacterium]
MFDFEDEHSYLEYLRREVAMPAGFRAASVPLSFTPRERPTLEPYRMNLNALVCDEPTDSFAGVFTRNTIAGDPVLIGRERIRRATAQGVLVNNRISNVCAPGGRADALALSSRFASEIGCAPEDIFPASTGIIGWKLPVSEMCERLPALSAALSAKSLVDFAEGIMTTDSFVKVRSVRVGNGSVVGIAKGAGMIEPDM